VTVVSAAAAAGPWPLAPDLDPALPGLAAAIDPAAVADLFRLRWLDDGPSPVIRSCALEHALWRPGLDCVATYRLDFLERDGESSTLGAVAISRGGVRHWLYNTDPALAGLAGASDPRAIGAWLATRLGGAAERYTVAPVRYRAGTRCVLRYQTRDRDSPPLYGKVVARNGGSDLAAVLAALGDSLVPPCVGVAPEWQLVVQHDAGDDSLKAVALDLSGPTAAAFAAAGDLLAQLHAHPAPHGPVRSLAGDVDELRQLESSLELVNPGAATKYTHGVAQLEDRNSSGEPMVASHGAYRADQVHRSARGSVMIDLDSYCLAEPARDAANFLAYLHWRAIRGSASPASVAHARDAFMEGYSAGGKRALDAERVRLFEAAAILKIAGRRCRSLSHHEWQHLPALIDSALDMLAAARGSTQ